MKFEDTTWFKFFGNCEYKVTFNDGKIIKSKGWHDDKMVTNTSKPTQPNREVKKP
jgi:hypothetical protein